MKNLMLCVALLGLFGCSEKVDFNKYKSAISKDFRDTAREENYLKFAGYKTFTVNQEDELTITPVFKIIDKYNRKGKRLLLKSFSASFAYTLAEYYNGCHYKENFSTNKKMQCYKKTAGYTFDDNIFFQIDDVVVYGKNVRRDFLLNADDVNEIKKLRKENPKWYIKAP